MTAQKKVASKIKVIGIGGAGGNAVSRMWRAKLQGVELVAMNADLQDLKRAKANRKVALGREVTGGLVTGMDPTLGRKAAEESIEEIREVCEGAEMVFIAAGLGGGTGSGASPVIARTANELGALTVGVVTLPFSFEGGARKRAASRARNTLSKHVDALITIQNDKILELGNDEDLSVQEAFERCDDVLLEAVQGITGLILTPGLINVDFADVRSIMKNSGTALFGVGRAKGEDRAEKAAHAAMQSPLLARSARGAQGVLFNVAGDKNLSLAEIEQVAATVNEAMNNKAQI